MNTRPALILIAALCAASPQVLAQHDAHHAPPPAAAAPAQRFATDATLRAEMQGIRRAVADLERNDNDAVKTRALAEQIESRVRTIIANCTLPPDADASLHAVIVPLMQNAGALKTDPRNAAAIGSMREALGDYAARFSDPTLDAER